MADKEKEQEQKQKEWKEFEQQLRAKTFFDNMFYAEEFNDYDYTEEAETIKKRVAELKEYIEEADIEARLKNNILNNKEFLEILSHFDIVGLLNADGNSRVYELATDYDHINNFFKDEDAYTILNLYGVVDKDDNGYYKLNDDMVDKIIQLNDYYIESEDKQKEVKELISANWEDQSKILTPDTLNEYSEKRNGISFKYFLFCEEYIKTGKMTEVAKKLGIGRRTCYDYMQKEEVKKYLQERQEEIRQENTNLMQQRFNNCFDTLYSMGVEHAEHVRDDIQIRAIDTFLKHYEAGVLKQTASNEE